MFIHRNTTLATHGWELESAEARHAAFPATFEIPPAHLRRTLQFGDRVKLLFLFHVVDREYPDGIAGCERMWVTVVGGESGAYTGLLEKGPVSSDALSANDVVAFDASHVGDILPRPNPVEFARFQEVVRGFLRRLGGFR